MLLAAGGKILSYFLAYLIVEFLFSACRDNDKQLHTPPPLNSSK